MNPITCVCTWWEDTGRMTPFINGISSPIFRRVDDHSTEASMRDLPDGALWAARREASDGPDDYPPVGPDGLSIVCKMPGDHHWYIDGRCSNCTRKEDRQHRCWIRHGTVGQPLTIDKSGNTCSAGAGSIQVPGWHGFLRNGVLVPC